MKKILIIHNSYRETGGEDIAVKNEVNFLSEHFEVETLMFDNKISNFYKQILYFLLNRNLESEKKFRESINKFKPDLIYIHNTWFKASIGIFKTLIKANKPSIIKLHNFRYFCTKSWLKKNHLDGNLLCPACGFDNKQTVLFNKYFEESTMKSFFMIIYGKAYFKILKNKNFKIIVLTEFHKSFLIKQGFDKKNIFVQHNLIKIKNEKEANLEKDYIVYAGRISKEKGVEELIKSFLNIQNKKLKLKIVGSGPSLRSLQKKYNDPNIQYLGQMKNSDVVNLIKNSLAVVTATKLYEGQPNILTEASLLGVPSVFPEFGGMPEFFNDEYSLMFEQYNYDELTKKINQVSSLRYSNDIGNMNMNYIKTIINEEKNLEKFNLFLNE